MRESPTIVDLVLGSRADDQTYGGLSYRQLEVVTMAAWGHHAKDIAKMLHISLSTVDTHLGLAYRKLGVDCLQRAVVVLRQKYGMDVLAKPCEKETKVKETK